MKDILGHLVGSEWAAEGNVGAIEAAGSPAGLGHGATLLTLLVNSNQSRKCTTQQPDLPSK